MVLELVKGYEALKPIIERIMENPTFADVNNLNYLLKEMSPKALEKLQDFILAHLMQNIIDPTINAELKISILKCVHTVVGNISISSEESILHLLSFLFSQVFDAKEPTMIRPVPEEMKLNVVRCALALTQNINEDLYLKMYQPSHVPAISHAIYICVTLAKLEMLQDLRITSMEVIMSLSLIPPIGALDTSDPEDRKLIANTIQFVLPGIVSNLVSIIKGPITQGSKITATAVRTLGGVIALVLEDYDWGNSEHSADTIMALVKSSMAEKKTEKSEKKINSKTCNPHDAMQRALADFKGRPQEWRSSSAKKLLPALEEIGKLKTHPHWRVRREIAWVATLIIARCPQSLYQELSPLLNALVHLKGDDQPEIRRLCLENISQIQHLFAARACKSFKQLVEENMYNLLTKLPRLVQEDCGENTPTVLSLLAGYIELLDSDLKIVLNVAAHLQRFSLAVLQTLVVDSSFIVLTSEYSFRELKSVIEGGLRAPWIRLEHCSDEEALHQISRLVEALSAPQTSDAFDLIVRQFLALIAAVPSVFCEAALFLNELLKTGQGDNLAHLASLALDVYLESNLHNVSIQGEMSFSQSQKNVAKICVLTEGIGCCIKAMKPDAVEANLLRALYPVLERAGSANYLVATAGLQALSLLANAHANATGHANNLVSLLKANMDYISHSLSTRLRRPHQNPAVFDALTLVLRLASPDTLPGIRDIVNDVLLRSCDEHTETHAEAHLRVFHTFAICMNGWLKGEEEDGQEELENDDENQVLIEAPAENVPQKWRSVNLLLEYHENSVRAEQDVEMQDGYRQNSESVLFLQENQQPHLVAEQQPMENREEEEKTAAPPHVLLLESVLRRSLHFVSSPDINIQFLALRTMAAGFEALSAFTDVLLPLGHETWAPLVGRLRRDQPPLIFRTAFGLLCTLADTCKHFLRPRVVKEIFPELSSVLESSVKTSHLQEKGSAYRFSQLYKLQKAILSRAGHLCINLQLEGADFRPLLMAALPYLNCYQPRLLQKHCVNLTSLLKSLDDDLVWWSMAMMWDTQSLTTAIKAPETLILLQQNQR